MKSSKEKVKGTDYVNSSIALFVAHVHLFHPVEARDLSNQQAKKLVSLLALSLARSVKARSQKQNLLSP